MDSQEDYLQNYVQWRFTMYEHCINECTSTSSQNIK